MKHFILILSFWTFFVQICNAQTDTIPKVDGEYQYGEVIKLDSSFTTDKLYRNAKLYFTDNYKNSNAVIQYDDKSEGKIIGNGFFSVIVKISIMLMSNNVVTDVYYSTEISCKDGRYRYRIYDIYLKSEGSGKQTIDEMMKNGNWSKKLRVGTYNEVALKLKATVEILKKYMSKTTEAKKDDF